MDNLVTPLPQRALPASVAGKSGPRSGPAWARLVTAAALALLPFVGSGAPSAVGAAVLACTPTTVGSLPAGGQAYLALTATVDSCFQRNDTFTVDVAVGTGGGQADAVDAFVDFNPARLQVVSIAPNAGSPLPAVLANSFDNSTGRVSVSVGRTQNGPAASGQFTLATITFRGIAPSPGTAVSFSSLAGRRSAVFYQGGTVAETSETGPVVGIPGASLTLTPSSVTAGQGQVFTVDLVLDTGPEGFDSTDVFLTFDPAALAFVDANGNPTTSASITTDARLTTLSNQVNANAGSIAMSVGRVTGSTITGSVVLATLRFKILSAAGGQVSFSRATPQMTNVYSAGASVLGPIGTPAARLAGTQESSTAPIPALTVAGGAVALRLNPARATLPKDRTVQITLIADATSLPVDSIDASLQFDPAVLAVVDAGGLASQVTIGAGSPLSNVNANNVNNITGRITLAVGRPPANAAQTGSFTLATFNVKALVDSGLAPLAFIASSTGAYYRGQSVLGTTTGATFTLATVPATPPAAGGGGGGGGGSAPPPAPPATDPETGSSPVDPTTGATVSLGSTVTVTVPAGALPPASGSARARLDTVKLTGNGIGQVQAAATQTVRVPAGHLFGSAAFNFSLLADDGRSLELAALATLRVHYTTDDLRQAAGGGALKVMRYEPETQTWLTLPSDTQAVSSVLVATTDRTGLFTLAIELPTPTLTGPAPAVVSMDYAPPLTWALPSGATQYQLQVVPANNDGPGINLIRDAEASYQVSAPKFGVGNYVLLPGMTYSWRVRSTSATSAIGENDAGWSNWSERTFRTAPASAATLSPLAPTPGSVVEGLTPLLQWTDSNDKLFYYEVQVSRDPAFGNDAFLYWELRHGGATQPPDTYRIPDAYPLQAGATYYWRVRPRVQGDGAPVAWSEAWSFQTAG